MDDDIIMQNKVSEALAELCAAWAERKSELHPHTLSDERVIEALETLMLAYDEWLD